MSVDLYEVKRSLRREVISTDAKFAALDLDGLWKVSHRSNEGHKCIQEGGVMNGWIDGDKSKNPSDEGLHPAKSRENPPNKNA